MCDTERKDITYLGPFHHQHKLKIREIQSMKYMDSDSGPFYLSNEEKETKRLDKISGDKKKKNYTQSQLKNLR